MYLVCKGVKTISEVVKFTPQFGSWLIGNSVQKGKDDLVTGGRRIFSLVVTAKCLACLQRRFDP
jgi:hypothetical protein